MKNITNNIKLNNNNIKLISCWTSKTLTRCQTKVENDYLHENYPTSAKILDINRCALQFDNIISLINFMKIFINKINNKKSGCITKIIRVKNGWKEYNENRPQYTDIKLNCVINNGNNKIIGEIQLLLSLMSDFKKVSHKLYSVERLSEFMYNLAQLRNTVGQFKHNETLSSVLIEQLYNNDTETIKLVWNSAIERNTNLIELMIENNSKQYLFIEIKCTIKL